LRAKSNHPVVVSTSQHITQGMIDLIDEEWNSETLSGTSKIIGGDTYEIRIAGLNDGAKWKLDTATVLNNTNNASIEVLPEIVSGWLRVVIKSNDTSDIKWQLCLVCIKCHGILFLLPRRTSLFNW
jgi:hypothetical protein